MAQTLDEIRTEIENTRSHMRDTVEAIGHRANLPGRAKEAVTGAVERVTGAMPDIGGMATRAGDALPSGEQVRQAASVAQSNPMGLMIGAAAVGFVAGLMLPSTRTEDEHLGGLADELKEQAREVGHEALEHGRDVVKQTAAAAGGAAQEAGREHGQELAETVQQRAQQIGET